MLIFSGTRVAALCWKNVYNEYYSNHSVVSCWC